MLKPTLEGAGFGTAYDRTGHGGWTQPSCRSWTRLALQMRAGLNSAGATDWCREYPKIRGQSKEDPLLPDIRTRAGS